MADEATGQQGGIEPEGEETDYKALWEQAKAHSREWEKKAKANKAAADELAKSKEASLPTPSVHRAPPSTLC